jgi:hypothetical protein
MFEVCAMTKTLTALAAAATIAITALAIPQQAEARYYGRSWGGGAVLGGLAAGAIIGGALAGPRYYGGYGYGYGGGPYYGSYGYYDGVYAYEGCFRQRIMTPYGWRWRRICR